MGMNARAQILLLVTLMGLGGCAFHQSIGHDAGAFLREVHGERFRPVSSHRWDSDNHALLYLYRPQSDWGDAELMAPSFYVDGNHYVNLRSGGYTWLEILPGKRKLDMNRPFFGIEGVGFRFSHILDAELTMEAGEIYFLRYSEVSEASSTDSRLPSDHPLDRGAARFVSRETAMEELPETRFMESVLMATNRAGTSIVPDNRATDYRRQGKYEPAPWYWPWGGGPTQPVETERERDQRKAAESAEGHWWWPF